MSQESIEVLGQKFSYPTTWQGVSAVFLVCSALTIVAFLFKGWATPDTIKAINGLYVDAAVQDEANKALLARIESLTARVQALEKKGGGSKASKSKPVDKKYLERLKKLFNDKSTLRKRSVPEKFKPKKVDPSIFDKIIK